MSLKRRAQKNESLLDLTPCSDVMFTLLLFYILTQSFVTQMPLQLPRLSTGESVVDTRQVRLRLERDGRVWCAMGEDQRNATRDGLSDQANAMAHSGSRLATEERNQKAECLLEPPWEHSLPKVLPGSDPSVLVVVHRESPAGVAVELLDVLRQLGVTDISFAGVPRTETVE